MEVRTFCGSLPAFYETCNYRNCIHTIAGLLVLVLVPVPVIGIPSSATRPSTDRGVRNLVGFSCSSIATQYRENFGVIARMASHQTG